MNAPRDKNPPLSAFASRLLLPLLAAALCMLTLPSDAARVDDLYTATVPLDPRAPDPLNAAFEVALAEVLVKVTGMPDVAVGAGRAGALPPARALVQQYARLPDNQLQARFDPRALRQAIDSAGMPVWGENRPLVALWYAVDAGGGRRMLMADAGGERVADDFDPVRESVRNTAARRGLPLVLPMLDASERSAVSFADVWGEFQGPVMQASRRYGAEAILIGRSRSFDPGDSRIRWTLTVGNEQTTWQGDAASGPTQAANLLAQRLATYADSAGTLRVLIMDIGTLEHYGKVNRYLAGLGIVEKAQVVRAEGDSLEFELTVRGDRARLEQALSSSRVLQPASSENDALDAGRPPDLVYSWSEGS